MAGPAIRSACRMRWLNSRTHMKSRETMPKALATYEKLLERTPEDETTRRKYMRLRAKSGLEPHLGRNISGRENAPDGSGKSRFAGPVSSDPSLDDETQRYVTQALTDVDLFSSYGLTQKAIDLSGIRPGPRAAPRADTRTAARSFRWLGQ